MPCSETCGDVTEYTFKRVRERMYKLELESLARRLQGESCPISHVRSELKQNEFWRPDSSKKYFFLSSLSPSSALFPFLCMSACMHDPWERSGFKFPMTFSHHLTPKHFPLKTRPDIRLLVCTCTCVYHPLSFSLAEAPWC